MKKIALILLLFATYFTNAQIINDNYTIKNISDNTKYQDYGISFYGEENVVFASSRKTNTIKKNIWKGNDQPYLQVYQGSIGEEGEIVDVEEFTKGVNTKFHDADLTFTKDLKTVYFTSNNYLNRKFVKDTLGWNLNQLYKAEIGVDGKWKNVKAMPFNNDNYQTGHPTLSSDEKKLYFISDMLGGFGLTDIYVVDILPDGGFGEPINLGPNVNTPGKEMFPYIDELNYLYFSSDGYIDGKGGLDVYVTRIIDNEVNKSFNVGAPINSISDDFSFLFQDGKKTGYFSSNREGGKGDDDIYWFKEKTPLMLYCLQLVSGTVTDVITEEPVEGALVVVYDELGNEVARSVVGKEATYNFNLNCNKNYTAVATKENYTTDTKEFFLEPGEEVVVPLKIQIQEFLVQRGKCLIKINPIYFNFDRSEIRPDAEKELNKVAEIMKKYPMIRIEAGSHTDSRGNNEYNERLSARRAKSTVNYLIKQGVERNRLTWKGYGETELANKCTDDVKCTEAAHQFNRRTEFSIINYGEIREVYSSICNIEIVSTKEQIEIAKQIQDKFENDTENKRKGIYNKDFETKNESVHIKMEPLHFELNSVSLNDESKRKLIKVVEKMQEYPTIIVECGSHTDSRSSFRESELLTRQRAQTIVAYITARGINPKRITARGYGESKLVNGCVSGVKCTEQEHAENRRVEFIILNPTVLFEEEQVLDK